MSKKITLKDVAELANVALGTASQALSGKSGVLPQTRARVLDAARQLGYDQRLKLPEEDNTQVRTIGVIKHDSYDQPGLDPFYFPVISGLEQECRRDGISMMYATAEVDVNNRAIRLPQVIFKQPMNGVVVVGADLNDELARSLQMLNCPVVLVDGYSEGPQFSSILTNNFDGAFQAVSYLVGQGHCHIGLIGSAPDSYPSILERRKGYLAAMQQHGIADLYVQDGLLKRADAARAAAELLQRCPQVTALFVCNDNCAFGAIEGARSLGIEVPGQLSVVGFDDIALAQDMTPPLTTMQVDKLRLGKLAVRMVEFLNENPGAPRVRLSVDVRLVARKSVNPVNA